MRLWLPIKEHVDWLVRLREHLYGAGDLPLPLVVRDDRCAVGHWLRDQAAALRHLPEYDRAVKAHAAFHRRAALVVALAASGLRAEAGLELAPGGGLRRSSMAMIKAFQELKRRADALEESLQSHQGLGASP